jgi:hypothetical protein
VPATGQDAYRAFVAGIQDNTLRYTKLFAEVADDHLANITATIDVPMDVFDILLEQVSMRCCRPRAHAPCWQQA